jgi:hypothetical protein
MWFEQRSYKEDNWGNPVNSAREAEKRWHYSSVDHELADTA